MSNETPKQAKENQYYSEAKQNVVSISDETEYPQACVHTRNGCVQGPLFGDVCFGKILRTIESKGKVDEEYDAENVRPYAHSKLYKKLDNVKEENFSPFASKLEFQFFDPVKVPRVVFSSVAISQAIQFSCDGKKTVKVSFEYGIPYKMRSNEHDPVHQDVERKIF